MKRIFSFWLAAIITTIAVSAVAAAQTQPSSSLGDYARKVKKTQNPGKTSTKVYDNDNLPTSSSLSVVGQAPAANQDKDAGQQAKDGEKSDTDTKAENALKPGQAADERQKALAAWKARLDEQRGQISLLSRELDVLKREHDLKASEFYYDTARRTQNPTGFAAEDVKYKQQIADKQKSLDAAKAKLDDLKDQARKSGAPNSVTE